MKKYRKMGLESRHNQVGWFFLLPATILICWLNFYPMIRALLLSFQTGRNNNMRFVGLKNYERILVDPAFRDTLFNTFIYLIVEVPIMLICALLLASLLNQKDLRFKGIYRTAIFLPCATSLVSSSMIFRSLFATEGFINTALVKIGMTPVEWFTNPWTARIIIMVAMLWRWTGHNMVYYQAALQNIEYTIYEAARIDGASPLQSFFRITIPLLKPTILFTTIMSTNGALQLFDESVNMTKGGPGRATMTMSHYIYDTSFVNNPNFCYAAALSMIILVLTAILAVIQMKVGDKR